MERRDTFGGIKSINFDATGFFRTQYDGHRWWLVTPLGNAFISFGINHYHDSWWAQDHNREFWINHFNAKEPYDNNWIIGYKDRALNELNILGINSLGIHTDAPMLTSPVGHSIRPYVAQYLPLKLCHYLNPENESFYDIFSDGFSKICENEAKNQVTPLANDPMIIGFCMSDCPIFTDEEATFYKTTTWPRQIRNLGGESPGKKQYVKMVSEKYLNIKSFNNIYKTNFKSWDDLNITKNWIYDEYPRSIEEKDDNLKFLLRCVDEYYKVSKRVFRKFDKNHLFFGDKINGNTNGLNTIIEITSKYTDLVNFQYYDTIDKHKSNMCIWSKKITTKQPILNGDSGFTVPTNTMPNTFGPHCKSQKERAQMYIDYIKTSLSRKDYIGWHMCGVIDTIKSMPSKEFNQHQGIMTTHGKYYPEMVKSIKYISKNLYRFALDCN